MEGLLTEVRSTRRNEQQDGDDFILQKIETVPGKQTSADYPHPVQHHAAKGTGLDSLGGILIALKNEPDETTFRAVLQALDEAGVSNALDLQTPGATQAKVILALVDLSLPTFWQALGQRDQGIVVRLLTNIAAINIILSKLQRFVRSVDADGNDVRAAELLSVLNQILQQRDVLGRIWQGLSETRTGVSKRDLAWKEALGTFGSGRLVSIPAESIQHLKALGRLQLQECLSGHAYTIWLADNVTRLAKLEPTFPGSTEAASQMLSKGLSLGYPQVLVGHLLTHSIEYEEVDLLLKIVSLLPASLKRRYIENTLAWLSASFPDHSSILEAHTGASAISLILQSFVKADPAFRQQLTQIVLDPPLSASISLTIRLAALHVLALEIDCDYASIGKKALSIFGDQLFIDHAPVAQQDAIAQTVIISAAQLKRAGTTLLTNVLRTSHHMQAVSNRLACSSPRARWLGMIVGTAISSMVDKPGSQMNFGTTDMQTDEALSWLKLIDFHVDVGRVRDLRALFKQPKVIKPEESRHGILPIIDGKQTFGPPRPPELLQPLHEITRVTELFNKTSDADDDLKPYAKPDDDPEDSDEDATLVNRNKVKPPVYIRSLLSMLRETEKADKFQLAIEHAAPLIRRKTGFGREITDHAEELARILTNLQDPFDTENFDQLRLQALIAIVLSDVDNIAPWLSRQSFVKDYSIAQRTIMLTALGLSGRELAGLKHEDRLNQHFENTSFPSKHLPTRLHAIYGGTMLLEDAAKTLEQQIIQPMALAAADHTTSHLDAVKVRKFSSRIDVARTRRKPVANRLAKILHAAYFYPLVNSLQRDLTAYGDASAYASSPMVLTTYLKTLALLLHAAGPATFELDSIIIEFWDLILSLRLKAYGDVTIMEALLFCLLTMLELRTNNQTMAQERPKQFVETKEWCEMVIERTGGGDLIEGQGEEARVRMLCAGVLTKLNDIISACQNTVLGV